MGFLKRLFGLGDDTTPRQPQQYSQPPRQPAPDPQTMQQYAIGTPTTNLNDEQALARYRYLLKTASPETIEQVHAEAFAKLSPDQRAQVLRELSGQLPDYERNTVDPRNVDPQSLARIATRSELQRPGTIERTMSTMPMGGMGGMGMGMGGMLAGTLLSSMVGTVVGSMIAQQIFESADSFAAFDGGGDFGAESGGDFAGPDGFDQQVGYDEPMAGDTGGDFGGDFGADFGGGDFDVDI